MTLPKRRPGRPTKYTPATRAAIVGAVRAGLPLPAAFAKAGISPSTYERWVKLAYSDPEGDGAQYVPFLLELEAAKAEAEAELVSEVREAAKEWSDGEKARRGDWRAAAWLLERAHGYAKPTATTPNVEIHLGSGTGGGYAPGPGRDVVDAEDGPVEPETLEGRVRRLRSLYAGAVASGSHQAAAAAERQLADAERELRADREKTGGLETLPEDEYLARLRIAAENMPEAHLRIFAEAWLDRHRLDTVPRPAPPKATKEET